MFDLAQPDGRNGDTLWFYSSVQQGVPVNVSFECTEIIIFNLKDIRRCDNCGNLHPDPHSVFTLSMN